MQISQIGLPLWQAALFLSRRENVYRFPAGERLSDRYTSEDGGSPPALPNE
jgi:hypothetical protein